MLRKLLACLALLTGLSAAGAPAQAEVAHTVAAQLEVSASVAVSTSKAAAVCREVPHLADRGRADRAITPACGPALVATVHLGSDRARE